jgi:hypothetical protein
MEQWHLNWLRDVIGAPKQSVMVQFERQACSAAVNFDLALKSNRMNAAE